VGRDRRRGSALEGDVPCHRLRGREPVGVDVVEGDLDVPELREREDVPQQVLREDDAARADERDPGNDYSFVDPSVRPPMN
jgi:hypothetical protein